MAHLARNIDFDRHKREAMANFTGQNVYSTSADAYGYANSQIYSSEAAAGLAVTNTIFTRYHTVAADAHCYGFDISNIKISGASGIIICEPGIIGSMVHLNASDEMIILKTRCRIDNDVYIGPGVVIGIGVHVYENVQIAGETEINNYTNVECGVKIGWNVRIGANVSIEKNDIIGRNVVIGESAIIKTGAVIEDNVRIGAAAKILRLGRIRAGIRVEDNVEIRSFDYCPAGNQMSTQLLGL
ncbi:hypothetical protein BPAE_0015g00950 [Botrytis paeoniae]|uniref:Mannose-1-phosphate guanyltransferase C-terminal domain-containing protein n=1 Tax=Botrytis paeoniae TaxID=278948 RepID=A0A4Z1G307_9HELO|nr:hypothetical protein BPAE_0015g00950 [Botrytis paeoniae]